MTTLTTTENNSVNLLTGIPVSSGVVSGRACRTDYGYLKNTYSVEPLDLNIYAELAKLKQAFRVMRMVCSCGERFFRQIGDIPNSVVFARHRVMLEDCGLFHQFSTLIKLRFPCESAVRIILSGYRHRLLNTERTGIRQHLDDLNDFNKLLVDIIGSPLMARQDAKPEEGVLDNQIAVAEKLTSRFVMEQYLLGRKGLIVEQENAESFAITLCKTLRMPAVMGISGLSDLFASDTRVALNGDTGQLVIPPQGRLRGESTGADSSETETLEEFGIYSSYEESNVA